MERRNRIKISYHLERMDIEWNYNDGEFLSEYHWSLLKRYIKYYYCDNDKLDKNRLTEIITNNWMVDEPLRLLNPKELKSVMGLK